LRKLCCVHIVALGVETVGIKLVVDVVYGRTVVGEQVRVYRRSAAKRSDRRHADGGSGFQIRNQLADASGESSTACREVFVIDVDFIQIVSRHQAADR